MKIKFSIDYRTFWGQRIFVCGSLEEFGSWNHEKAAAMSPSVSEQWNLELEVSSHSSFEYKYFLLDEQSGAIEWEGGANRLCNGIGSQYESLEIRDFWRPKWDQQNTLYTSPFMQAFFRQTSDGQSKTTEDSENCYRIQLRLPRVGQGYAVGVIGSHKRLGEWDNEKVALMSNDNFPVWQLDIPFQPEELPLQYKYVIYDKEKHRIAEWEGGDNRYIPITSSRPGRKMLVWTDETFRFQSGNWRGAGVAIPVFSLRTEKGTGVGEFTDIKLLVDWSVKTGNKLIQVLPVNDTVANHNWTDSYPYAGISVFGLHPMYANLEAIGALKNNVVMAEFGQIRSDLNKLDHVAYEQVMSAKSRYFKLAYEEQKTVFLKSAEFKSFFKKNENWLIPYAAFSCLRDKFKTPDFSQWPEHSNYDEKTVKKFVDPKAAHYDDVAIHYFIQFHLDKQLKEATAYARSKGVVLKGDIPIGIYRYSVDAWTAPHLYNMDCQAGAPPDDFSITGQNWGFPTYNWAEMSKDGYAWWKERLTKMADYFDVFRIDHILGFFRIWEIPMSAVEGLFGHFNPCMPFSTEEINNWGLWFDKDRYCKPYIRGYMLVEMFGDQAEMVRENFLDEYKQDHFRFKPAYDNQRKLKDYLDNKAEVDSKSEEHFAWLKTQLFKLHAEVLFLEGDRPNTYNLRIGLQNSYSYRELDDHSRDILNKLYGQYFYKRHNSFWRDRAMEKLPAIKTATEMLICGEDLGMVPESVPGVMSELQILSLAVQRMPSIPEWEFWHPADTPYLSVTTTSSHDTSTIRGWWEEDSARTQRFYNNILGNHGIAPQFCEPWVVSQIVNQHLHAPAMWAIFPIQDLLAMDGRLRRVVPTEERINIPAIPNHYWKYRLHLTIEQLLEEDDFNAYLRKLADESGRNRGY